MTFEPEFSIQLIKSLQEPVIFIVDSSNVKKTDEPELSCKIDRHCCCL